MRVGLICFLTFIYCLSAGELNAQGMTDSRKENILHFSARLLDVQNGLPQGYVNGIVQDKAGFIWMGTRDGLARYDGYQVKVFRYDPADTGTIASNVIQTIYADRENKIWILYENNAVDIFDPVTESVTHVTAEKPLGWLAAQRHQFSFYLHEDSNHRFWVVSSTLRGLQYFTRRQPAPVAIPVPPNEMILALGEDQQGAIWVCTNRALYRIRDNSFHEISALPEQPVYRGNTLSSMVQDTLGNWLIRNSGLIEIYHPEGTWAVLKTPHAEAKTLQYLMVKSAAGNIYFNAAGHIYQLHDDHTISPVWSNPHRPYDFFAMMTDRSGVLWAGMDTFGAVLINLSSKGFHSYPYQYGFVMDVLTNWFHIPFSEKAKRDVDSYLPRNARDRKGGLWFVGTPFLSDPLPHKKKQLHVFLFDGKHYTPRFFHFPSLGWLQIAFDHENNCWGIIKSDSLGKAQLLVKADLSKGTITPVLKINRPYYEIGYLTALGHNLCIVYNDGLQLYNAITGKSVFYAGKTYFGNITLLMATPDPIDSQVLWLSTMGNGLIRFNTGNGKISAFTEKNGIPSNTIYGAFADRQGYLWCSSNKGIFRFNPVDHTLRSFTAMDGLQGNEFNRYHFMETADGRLFFGGTQGWTYFHPDSIHIDSFQPPSAITNILVNNKVLTAFPKWKDSAVNALQALVLSYDQNFVTFSFSGLEFSNSDKLQYRFRLQGFDKDWVEVGSQHMANYTNLPPGKYIFQVNTSNKAGNWSSHIKTLELSILPPWWKTWWAYLVYGILILMAGYAFYRNRMHRLLIKHTIILKEKESAHLKQLDEMKSRFFSNITHEFRTPLSLILGPLEQLIREKDAPVTPVVKRKLASIHRNAEQLLRLINQLLDMSKMEAGNMAVSLSRGDLGQFIADHTHIFASQAAQKNIHLQVVREMEGDYLFDIDKMQKIIFNLLSNALKFTPEGGVITVRATYEGRRMLLSVKDTGMGIAEEHLPLIFNRFYQVDNSSTSAGGGTGIGLALTKELIGLMGGTIEVDSQLDLGTSFLVSIPVKEATNEVAADIKIPSPTIFADNSYPRGKKGKRSNVHAAVAILVVEDNRELNQFIHETLGIEYRMLDAFDGKEGLNKAVEEMPDIIISDIMMPEMDGYALCEKIKTSDITSHIGFMLLSARSSHHSVVKGLKYFADDYITKPFHPDELLLRVRNQANRLKTLREFCKKQILEDGKSDQAVPNDPFLQKLYGFIARNIDNRALSVEMLAEEANMSHRTLNRKLEMMTGLSGARVIKQYRLKASALLLRSGCSVSEVAYRTGFESPFYFSASFKEFYGVAPSKYAKRQGTGLTGLE